MIRIRALGSSSRGNCYLIDDGNTNLLLDCGFPIRELRKKINHHIKTLHNLSACLVTHEHMDHAEGALSMANLGIPMIMSRGTAAALGIAGEHSVTVMQPQRQREVGSWIVKPFKTTHDAAEPFGYLLASENGGKVLFATDTCKIPPVVPGLTHLVIEANYQQEILAANLASGSIHRSLRDRVMFSHLSIADVLEYLGEIDTAKLQEIHLIHLSDGNSNAAEFRRHVMAKAGCPVYISEA